ncbi:molybdate ABC transporter substrate-binding protein [Maricaulis sp.]|uniref:molybdate ABC transporter substrate-binding protein n=1 Tax=Maricaulis sp. TaxID=1486257 RepID=UPI0025B911F5|nr:molybdate ABC transporter substrate-binding protein [Maricaulis sp.]
MAITVLQTARAASDQTGRSRLRWAFDILAAGLAGLVLLTGCRAAPPAGEITVFAASSLRTALDEIGAEFERQTGHHLTLAYAGSPVLARQISLGAPADIFMSANSAWMDRLETEGRIEADSRFDLVGNRLVLIAHGSGRTPWPDITFEACLAELGDRRMAMALLGSVPAGIYGEAALRSLGLWEDLSGNVVQADNARAALALVAIGEAPIGLVYRSDALAEPRVSVLFELPASSHPGIRYPVAITAGRASDATRQFFAFLRSAQARGVLEEQGFVVDE